MQPGFGLPFNMPNMPGMPGMDQLKTSGAHLNPAFLPDMGQGGSLDPSKNTPQSMVINHSLAI